MNWIEARINNVREKNLTELNLDIEYEVDARDNRSQTLPVELFQLTQLKKLSISGWLLRELPAEIEKLELLEEFALSTESECKLPDTIENLANLKKLNIFGPIKPITFDLSKLKDLEAFSFVSFKPSGLPEELAELKKLRALAFATDKNSMRADARVLEEVGPLTEMDITAWSLNRTPNTAELIQNLRRFPLKRFGLFGVAATERTINEIKRCSTIEVLTLHNHFLNSIPVQLSELLNLHTLHMSGDGAIDIPDDIGRFKNLQELDIAGSKGKIRLTSGILALSRLRRLSLSRFHVVHLLSQIFDQFNFESLELHDCEIETLPKAFEKQSGVNTLNLSQNKFKKFPNAILSVRELVSLNLSGCPIGRLPNEIGNMKCLKSFSANSCGLTAIPSSMGSLRFLAKLDLSDNAIEELPKELVALEALEDVRVGKNQLRRIAPELAMLPLLRNLELQKNPLESPPPEIISQGLVGIQNYFSAFFDAPAERLFEAKLLIVGEGAVGKTSLMNKLTNPRYKLPNDGEGVPSTEGIDIRRWSVQTSDTDDFLLNLWDFGGQEIYHATHQFFLTKRSLYLFVWDARREDRTGGFDYWLNIIRLLSGGSPIFVILNKADERVREIDEAELKAYFPNILEFHKVSVLTDSGMSGLRRHIALAVSRLPHVGDRWPLTWSNVRKALESNPRDYIGIDEFESICDKAGLAAAHRNSLASYLHDLGVILHYQDDPVLQRILILKPAWGTNAVYRVLDTPSIVMAKGRFSFSDLRQIWKDQSYPSDRHIELLQLMIKFELCFPLGNSGTFVAPELLSAEQPNFEWDSTASANFEYQYSFMPAGIMSRLVARMHSWIEGDNYWRNGVVICWNDTRALVLNEPLNRRIRISLKGRNRRQLLSIIRNHVDEIHRTLNEPNVSEMVCCNCVVCSREQRPHLFAYKTLEACAAKGIDDVLCEKSLDHVAIQDLLADVLHYKRTTGETAASKATYVIERAENIYISNENAMINREERNKANNPWISGSFYMLLVAMVVVLLLAVGRFLSPWWLPIFIIGSMLLITVVGAFQLRNDERLQEKRFMNLMALAFRQMPLIGKLMSSNSSDIDAS